MQVLALLGRWVVAQWLEGRQLAVGGWEAAINRMRHWAFTLQ